VGRQLDQECLVGRFHRATEIASSFASHPQLSVRACAVDGSGPVCVDDEHQPWARRQNDQEATVAVGVSAGRVGPGSAGRRSAAKTGRVPPRRKPPEDD